MINFPMFTVVAADDNESFWWLQSLCAAPKNWNPFELHISPGGCVAYANERREVVIITTNSDPDTAERLIEWAGKFQAHMRCLEFFT